MPVIIDGVIGWDVTAFDIRQQLKDAGPGPVDIEISSPGGSVFEGLSIYNLIKAHKGETTATITGLAASMASYIALSADNVQAHENSVYMVHNPRIFAAGDHRDLRKTAARLESLAAVLSKKYVAKTGKPDAEIRQLMDDETFLYGAEIKDAGFADAIIPDEESGASASAQAENIELARMALDDCTAKMKAEEDPKDLERAAALLATVPANKASKAQPHNQQREKDMDLEEFLASNPEAKVEYEALLAAAKKPEPKEPVADPKAEVKPDKQTPSVDVADVPMSAAVIAKSDKYPATIQAIAVDVLTGLKSKETLDNVVAFHDMQVEQAKSAAAKAETDKLGDTPAAQGEPTGIDKDGTITSQAGLYAAGAQIKAQAGKGAK